MLTPSETATAILPHLRAAIEGHGMKVDGLPIRIVPGMPRAKHSWRVMPEQHDLSGARFADDVLKPVADDLAQQIASGGGTVVACAELPVPNSANGAHARDAGLIVRVVQSFDIDSDDEIVRIDVSYRTT